MRKVSQNPVRDPTLRSGEGTINLSNGFRKACGRFARDNVPLDTNQAPVYAGMTCRKWERQIGRLAKSGKDALHWRSFSTALGKVLDGRGRLLFGATRAARSASDHSIEVCDGRSQAHRALTGRGQKGDCGGHK